MDNRHASELGERLSFSPWDSRSWGGVLTVLAALPVSLWLFGFSVDDALISVRVAQNLATGSGYRFNSGGPVVDAVTPLGWAQVLTLLYDPDPWKMLLSARVLGLVAWGLALLVLGQRIASLEGERRGWKRWWPLLPLALSAPLGVWSSSGMETGLVTLMATVATGGGRRFWLVFAGLAAAWRPELLGWAVVLGLGRGWPGGAESRVARLGWTLLSVSGPFVLVALVRIVLFGQAAPLSAIAKPTELSQGIFYSAHALLWTGLPCLLLSPQVRGISAELRAVAIAALAHFLFVALVGGDWMSLYRLVVPVLPSLVLVAASVCEKSSSAGAGLRIALASGMSGLLLFQLGPAARGIVEQRRQLAQAAEPFLTLGGSVGTLDVGWVGASTYADIFDFAGVTDPKIALLCCGHHAKKIGRSVLEQRDVNTLVLLLAPREPLQSPWWQSKFARFSENYVAHQLSAESWVPVAEIPLKNTEQHYVILHRSLTRTAHGNSRPRN